MLRGLFCASHRDALDGALLGYYFMLETRHAEKHSRKEARRAPSRSRSRKSLRRRKDAAQARAAPLPVNPRIKPRPAESGAAVRDPHPPEAAAAPQADVR